NKICLVRKFNYDGHGNILKNIVVARITKNEGNIQFNDDLSYTYSCDRLETTYTYSDDGFNLKESECDPNGNYTYYEYLPGTNLITAKFICDKTSICKREFFTYDENGLVNEHIFDDGTSRDKNLLDGVTERHKREFTYRLEMPHFGEVLETNEYYYDSSKAAYVWCKRENNHFDSHGRIVKKSLTDCKGGTVEYAYEYDDKDRLIKSTDPLGNTETLSYDPITARLISKKSTRDDVSWHYTYDSMGHIVKETERHKNGLELTTEYEYDYLGRKIAVKDAQNNVTRYRYDALDRLTEINYPDMYDHTDNKIAPKKTYTYRNLGSEVAETNEIGLTTTTCYNALGKITDQEFPDGSSKKCRYDLKGNVIEEIAQNGSVTKMSYDSFDRLVESHQAVISHKKIVYNGFHAVEEIGPTDEHIIYSYDPAGMLIRREQNDRSTTYSYDARMRLKEERTELENGFIAKSYLYDDLNRMIEETRSDHKADLRTYKAYEYDAVGNQTAVIQNIGGQEAKTRTSYHPHALPERHIDAEGNTTLYHYNYRYKNQHGQTVICKHTIDAKGCTLEELFDARGNTSSICLTDPMGRLLARKLHFYDASNNLIRIEEHAISQSGENIITTLFEYKNGHLASLIEASDTPEQKKTQYFYNKAGELETILHADGTVLNHRYDIKGRLAHFYSSDYSIDYSYSYDASDRLVEVLNGSTGKKTIREYNSFGELTSETLETGLTTTFSYDNAGQIRELTLPDASKIIYERSSFLDSISRKNADDHVLYTHNILERDLSGFIKSVQLPAQAGKITFTHDTLGRNTSISHGTFQQKSERFDALGNLLHLHTKDPIGTSDRNFSYDFLSQLIQETGPSTHSYSYDSLYNRLKRDDTSYEINSLHSVLSDAKRTFSYDTRGNRTQMQTDKGTFKYTYDALDRLIEVVTPEASYSYSYDPFNRRLSKNGDELYLYAFDNEIGSADAEHTIKELRILGEGLGAEIGASIALELDGKTYIPLHDRQGNITTLLDTNGTPVETYRYDAFGNELTIGRISPWRFSSKRTDLETGLVYFGRRYYDPTLGKWLTQDPLGLKAGPNLYAYVLNGPMTRFDEYGLYLELEKDQCERIYSRNGNHVVLERSYTTYNFEGDHDYNTVQTQQKSLVKSEFISAGDQEIPGVYIISVNGIFNKKTSAQDNLNYLSFLGDNVKLQGLWNATHGPFD
ncbi:MAG: RHS repeat-associated core domain-containing protein, partial [Verrucomicrobia bacterium]|nr:RHS repeat-associated core domain-containing protein [Verrucomicrobiota bacterium]